MNDPNDSRGSAFRSMIQVIPTVRPSPIFVVAMCPWLLNIKVPRDLDNMPLEIQLNSVCDLYRKHREKYEGWPKGKGFVFHRSYDESYEFDENCCLVKKNTRHVGISQARLQVGGSQVHLEFEEKVMDNQEIQGKFTDVLVDEDTTVILEKIGTLDQYEVLYQAWSWDGINAESIIFLSEDVSDLSDEQLKALVKSSPLVNQESKLTVNDRSGKYSFVNFNFKQNEDD